MKKWKKPDYILQFPNIKPEEISLLQNNLLIILDKISPLALSAKAFNLLSENKTTFIESRIISDIRLVFDNDIIKKNRLAVLVHNLKIVTTENDERKEFYFSLDTNDLKMLKTQIERAEKKDELIRHQYSNEIQFIKIND